MNVDLTKILTNQISSININEQVEIPNEKIVNSRIDELTNLKLNAKITLDEENELNLEGIIKGEMLLKDDITLEPVNHEFTAEIEEKIEKNSNILDITDILWQNILVEIPSKVRAKKEDIELSGDGWRVISEEKYLEERAQSNNPFSELNELLNIKEEK